MRKRRGKIVTEYAKMWPRIIFNIKAGKKLLPELRELLTKSGVYVLYREDQPYYVGKATRLFSRIRAHTSDPKNIHFIPTTISTNEIFHLNYEFICI